MKKTIIALAAAGVLAAIQGHAEELSEGAWHKKFFNCEMTDRRGPNHDGAEVCMSRAQMDAFTREMLAHYEPGYKNCLREAEDAKRLVPSIISARNAALPCLADPRSTDSGY